MLPSPPSRRRGLKFCISSLDLLTLYVASFSEAWIEIIAKYSHSPTNSVASFSEAWIEILSNKGFTAS